MHSGRQATGKATLHPVPRTKGGKTFWVARGVVPIRRSNGEIVSRPVERGFGPDIRTESQRLSQCAEWNREYELLFKEPWRSLTFARAYINYIGKGHPVPWKAEAILEGIGELCCAEIDDSVIHELCEDIWPEGVSAKTLNRHIYSPVISILHVNLKQNAPHLSRPKGHRDITAIDLPPEDWYERVAPHLSPDQLAVMIFLAMHGRRIGEALSRTPKDLNLERGILDLGKTKTGVRVIELNPKCIPYIARPGWERRKWLFGCGPSSANSFRRDFKARCINAGLPYYTPHVFGRHMSVTRMLRAKYSTKHVADAHGMTEAMVATRYGHLTQQESMAALHEVGGQLFDRIMDATPALMLEAPVELEVVYDREIDAVEGSAEEAVEAVRSRHR
jgi:hypothetical protein